MAGLSDFGNEKVRIPTLELTRQRLTTAPPERKQAELAGRYARVRALLATNHRGVTLLASMEEKSPQATTSLICKKKQPFRTWMPA
jgi:hypothetical protein